MKYTNQEVLQYVEEEGVKFIRLAFCDIDGIQKNISIMPRELDRAFSEGISIDENLRLIPDASTLAQLIWRPDQGRVVRMYCKVIDSDSKTYKYDYRSMLAEIDCDKCTITTQSDFYLFVRDDEGNPSMVPYDNATYLDIAPADKGENVRRSICLTMEEMGCLPISSCHSFGPGQNRIAFNSKSILSAADDLCTFRTVTSTMAAASNLHADFSLAPITDKVKNTLIISLDNENVYRFTPGAHPYQVFYIIAKSLQEGTSLPIETINPSSNPLIREIMPC